MKKCQSALEYLLTYSWAFIIIVIIGAALFYLGVFNPATSTAIQVRGLSNFHIDDGTLATDGDLVLEIGTRTGKTTRVTNLDYSVQGYTCANTVDEADETITTARTSTFSLVPDSGCTLTFGDSVILDVNIIYTAGTSTLSHTDTGTITITVS